jgi:hypothetical protein
MISVKADSQAQKVYGMWRGKLCCDCEHFVNVPFTIGKCARKAEDTQPSIVDERAFSHREHRCGPKARYFKLNGRAAFAARARQTFNVREDA